MPDTLIAPWEEETPKENNPILDTLPAPWEESTQKPIGTPEPEIPLKSAFPYLISKGIEAVGRGIGAKPIEEFGQAGQEYLRERKPGPLEAASHLVTEVTPAGYEDIPTHFLKGMTLEYAPAIPTPEDASTLHKIATSAAHLAGMGVGIIPISRGLQMAGLLPKVASVVGAFLRGAEIGAIYGGISKPEEEETRLRNALKYAVMFGAFEGAGGLLEAGASKLLPETVGRTLEKIQSGETLLPFEKQIFKAVRYGRSIALGGGAGAVEPAETWQERLRNILMGGATFGLSHGITEGLGIFKNRKLKPEIRNVNQKDVQDILESSGLTKEEISEIRTGTVADELFKVPEKPLPTPQERQRFIWQQYGISPFEAEQKNLAQARQDIINQTYAAEREPTKPPDLESIKAKISEMQKAGIPNGDIFDSLTNEEKDIIFKSPEFIEKQKQRLTEGKTLPEGRVIDDQTYSQFKDDIKNGRWDEIRKSARDLRLDPTEIEHNLRADEVAGELSKSQTKKTLNIIKEEAEKILPPKAEVQPPEPLPTPKPAEAKVPTDKEGNIKWHTWVNQKGYLTGDFYREELFGKGGAIEDNKLLRFIGRNPKEGKQGIGFDQLAQMAYAEGLIPNAEPETLLNAMKNRQYKPPAKSEEAIKTEMELPLGAEKEALKGAIPTKEFPETEIEKATKEAEERKAEAEMKAKQVELPVEKGKPAEVKPDLITQMVDKIKTWGKSESSNETKFAPIEGLEPNTDLFQKVWTANKTIHNTMREYGRLWRKTVEEAKPTNWEQGQERPFAFDPNSTKNEGRFRLLPPDQVAKDSYFRRKSTTNGVSYLMGKDKDTGKKVTQAIRFNKNIISEEQAGEWWEKNKDRFKFNKETEKGISLGFLGTQGYDMLISDLRKAKDALPKLIDIGKKVWSEGKTNFNTFKDRMKEILGDMWGTFKNKMLKVFYVAKEWNKKLGEAGAISFGREKEEPKPSFREFVKSKGYDFSKLKETSPELRSLLEGYRAYKRGITEPTVESNYQRDKIAWEPKKFDFTKDGIKDVMSKLYTKFVMSEYPVAGLVAKSGKPEIEDKINRQIRRIRGLGGIVEELLTGKGIVDYGNEDHETEYIKDSKSLKDILKPLKTKELYMDYETLRIAERDVALATHRPDIKGTDLEGSSAEISRLEAKYGDKIQNLRNISKQHREFEREAILKPLVKSGWMSEEVYNKIVNAPEAEYYASFSREMEELERQSLGGKEVVRRIRGSELKKIPTVESTIANINKAVKLVETQKLNRAVVGLRDLTPDLAESIEEARPTGAFPPRGTITVGENGVKKYYKVPEDVRKALDYYSPQEIGTVRKLMNIPTRLLRAGATLTVEFINRNPVRDQFTAMVYSKYGYVPFWDFGKGLFHLLKKDDLYHEFNTSGAEQAFFYSMDRTSVNVTTRDIVGYGGRRLRTYNPIEGLRIWSNYMEKATRMGVYAKARAKGAIPLEAATEARESTVDFARIGTEGRVWNMIIAFWNANVQGVDIMARKLFTGENKGKNLMKAMMGITLPSIMLWIWNHNDERYKRLPEWQKNLFWIFPIKDGPIIRIPKPFELGIVFGSLPERILDYINNNDPKALSSIVTAAGNGASPGLIPTAGLPIVEWMTNHSFFLDRQIENETMKNLPPGMRSMSYTSKIAKKFGETVNISPLQIDNMIRGWSGGIGQYATDILGAGMKDKIPEVGKKWYEGFPGVKGFIAKEPLGSISEPVNNFYDLYERISQADRGFKVLRESGNREDALKYYNKNKNLIYAARVARREAKRLSNIRQYIKRTQEASDLSPDMKRQRIDELNLRMTESAERFNRIFEKRVKD